MPPRPRRPWCVVGSGLLLAALAQTPVHAACQLAGSGKPVELWLPPTQVAAAADAPIGAALGTVQVTLPRDVPLACTGTDNVRSATLTNVASAASPLADVHPTNLAGIGMRITARGGSFAGIDDAGRTVPYQIPMAQNADRLTGLNVSVTFVKTAPVENGTLAGGPLMSLSMGGTLVASVRVPANAITFQTLECQRVTPHGMVEMGAGTMGSYTSEAVGVQIGCGNGLNVILGVETTQLYGRPDLSRQPAAPVVHAAPDNGAPHMILHAHGQTTENGSFATGRSRTGFDATAGGNGGNGGNGPDGTVYNRSTSPSFPH
ncbi:MAG: hypothetical protein ACRYHA_19780 [Janthinobacterium lividum]